MAAQRRSAGAISVLTPSEVSAFHRFSFGTAVETHSRVQLESLSRFLVMSFLWVDTTSLHGKNVTHTLQQESGS